MNIQIFPQKFIIAMITMLILLGCRSSENINTLTTSSDSLYIVKMDTSLYEFNYNDSVITLREFYCDYNIILIDSLENIFYHKRKSHDLFPDPKPSFIYLKIDDIKKTGSIKSMMKIIRSGKKNPARVYLISNNDTITDYRYFKIKSILKDQGIGVSSRILTEEENYIVQCKLLGRQYDPKNYLWKNTIYAPD
jgi:hypothetical protein